MASKENNVKESKKKSHYFKDMKAELKKVIWPSAKQTVNNTLAVIVFTLVAAIIVFILDVCFDSINKYGVTPLQQKIQSSYNQSSSEENTEATQNNEESNEQNNGEEENNATDDEANIEVKNDETENKKAE